jgi:hypothetical protein
LSHGHHEPERAHAEVSRPMPSTPLTAPARKKIRAAAKKSGTGCGTRCDALLLRGAPTKPRFFVTGPCASDQTNLQFLVLACERATLTAASAELHMTLAASPRNCGRCKGVRVGRWHALAVRKDSRGRRQGR